MKYVFLRDDDACSLEPSFCSYVDLLEAEGCTATYAVIPGRLQPEFVSYVHLKKLCVVLHGNQHTNYGTSQHKYEFGPTRSFMEQKTDIIAGRLILQHQFKNQYADVFVPPFHGYDHTTLRALQDVGVQGFSSRLSQDHVPGIYLGKTLPVHVGFDGPGKIQHAHKSAAEVFERLKSSSFAVVVTHHHGLNLQEFQLFLRLLKPYVRFLTMKELCKGICTADIRDITLELTNQCNLRCKMCGIWEERPFYFLEPMKIGQLFSSCVLNTESAHVSLTGGECFLHPQIDEITQLAAPRKITVVSNGILTDKILTFAKRHCDKKIAFDFSIDGLESNHDMQRGIVGSFKRTFATIHKLKTECPHFPLSVKMTINRFNIQDILPLYDLCSALGVFFLPKCIENGLTAYYHRIEKDASFFGFSSQDIKLLKSTLLDLRAKDNGMFVSLPELDALVQHFPDKKVKNCLTPYHSLFVTSRGMVHSCLYMKPLFNLNAAWEEQLLGSAHVEQCLHGIRGTCKGCLAYHGYLRSYNLGQ